MIIAARFLLFLASTIGTWEWFRRKTGINCYFLPSLAIAAQVTILFAAGLLNLLYEAAVIIYIGGIIALLFFFYRDKSITFLKNYVCIGFVYLLIISVVMLLFVRGKHFSHVDNFTHWAIVVKEMLRNNRFPNFSDKMIDFQSYPLGSSSYIYYFSKMTGSSESIQMFSQIYMMLACILPMYCFCRKNKISAFLVITAATNFFFVYNIFVTNLLVDTLLPLAAMCSFVYLYFYGKKVTRQFSFYSIAFYMILLMQIKNSGIFFVLFIAAEIIRTMKYNSKSNFRSDLLCVLAPFLSLFLWQKHFLYAFENSERTNHAMTFRNLFHAFAVTSQTSISGISVSLFQFILNWKDIRWVIYLLIFTGCLVLLVKEERSGYLKIVLFSFLLFVLYQIGLLGMYAFSMGTGADDSLIEIVRYDKTILTAIIYLFITLIIKMLSSIRMNKYVSVLCGFLMIGYFCGFMNFTMGEIKTAIQYYEEPPWYLYQRMWLDRCKGEFVTEEDDTYCILTQNRIQQNYLKHAGRYVFYTDNIRAEIITDMEKMDDVTEEYILIYDDKNEIIQKWVRDHYPEQTGNRVIRRWDLYPNSSPSKMND